METVGDFFFFFLKKVKDMFFLEKSIRPGRKPCVEVTQGKQRSVLNNLQRLLSALINEGDLQTHVN